MPGPNSAPNGDRSLVHGWTTRKVWDEDAEAWRVERITVREKTRRSGKLRTGKTDHQKRR